MQRRAERPQRQHPTAYVFCRGRYGFAGDLQRLQRQPGVDQGAGQVRERLPAREEQRAAGRRGQHLPQPAGCLQRLSACPSDLGVEHRHSQRGVRFEVESHEHPERLPGALGGLVDLTHLQVGQPGPGVGERGVERVVAGVGAASAASNRRSASAGSPAARAAAALAIRANERPQLSPLSVSAAVASPASCCGGLHVAELGGGERVDGAAHRDAPALGQRLGQRDQGPRRRPAVGEPALQHAYQRLGAGAPGQPAGVVELAEQLCGVGQRAVSGGVIAAGGRRPGQMLQRPGGAAAVFAAPGQLEGMAEPLFRAPQPAGVVIDQPQLADGRRHPALVAGRAGLRQRGGERLDGLSVAALLLPQLAEHDQHGQPQLAGGAFEGRGELGVGLVEPAQRGERRRRGHAP